MGAKEVEAFLSYLANDRKVSPSTHCQALAAILYLYKEVLDIQLPWMEQIGRPKQRIRVPVVLSRSEVAVLLFDIDNSHRINVFWLPGRPPPGLVHIGIGSLSTSLEIHSVFPQGIASGFKRIQDPKRTTDRSWQVDEPLALRRL